MCGGGGGSAASDRAQQMEEARQERIRQGMSRLNEMFSPQGEYNDNFYNKAYQAQLDYALPQVDQQFQNAQRELQYGLARQGMSASSTGSALNADLEGQRQLALQGVQDQAQQARNNQVASVEGERDNLTRLLQSTGDTESTMNAAAGRASALRATPTLQEVGPLFQNATSALADMFVSPAVRAAGATRSAGYGGGSKGSGKVVS